MGLSAVVVAAGRSQRMGFDKLLTPLAGRPLLLHTIERLQRCTLVKEIILVIRPEAQEQIESLIQSLRQTGPIILVAGGSERQDSVVAGLGAVDPSQDYVLIHDAARPLVTPALVELVYEAAQTHGAAVCGKRCSDTLKQAGPDGQVTQTVDRSQFWTVQTPQIFRLDLLRRAYQAVQAAGKMVTDDTAAVESLGEPVKIVDYPGVNLKVTEPADWALATSYLHMGEADSPTGQELRRLVHDFNNHLTPLLGYAFLLENEFTGDSRGKKFASNIQLAGDKCHKVAAAIQKIIRDLFPRREEVKPAPDAGRK